jgi:membrane-bound serine protease (ClpP class)
VTVRSRGPGFRFWLALALGLLVLAGTAFTAQEKGLVVVVAQVKGAVSPAMTSYVDRVLKEAREADAQAVVLQLDTPGGLVSAMRGVVKSILNSPVPVIVYVAPQGAQAASAGVMITLSAHLAAMAPGSNIGAAHPVAAGGKDVQGEMSKKVLNDMIAYARSLADQRGRNADWAEKAVRYSVSLPAVEAAAEGVVDVVAPNLEALLAFADGRRIKLAKGETVIRTTEARIITLKPSLKDKILGIIANPNLAYLLLMLGLLGIYLEMSHPGAILPGAVGAVSLILAFFAMQTLPVSLAGLLLIVVGVALFLMEIWVTSYGLLSLGGVGCLVVGSIMLFDTPEEGLRLAISTIIITVTAISAFFGVIILLVWRSQKRRVSTGAEGMIGKKGRVLDWSGDSGKIFAQGEIWRAQAGEELSSGQEIEVAGQEGMLLTVQPANPKEE